MASAMPWDNDPIVSAAPSGAGNPWDNDRVVRAAPPPVTYDAAEFARRVGRAPAPAELANFAASKGAGFAGDPGASPAAGESTVNDVGTGVGVSIDNTLRGAKQLAMQAGHKVGLVSDQSLAANQAQVDAARREAAPYLATTGGKVGNLAGDVAQAALLPGEGALGAIGGGAALGGLQPTGGDDSGLAKHLENAALGGLAGAAGDVGGRVVGRVIQPIRNVLDSARLQALQTLRQAGVPLDLAQATGSRVADWLKGVAGSVSPTFSRTQQDAYNGAVLRTFGETATKASADVMQRAENRIGAVFDDIAARNPVALDQPLLTTLADLHKATEMTLSGAEAAPVKAQIDNIINKASANGSIDGSAYQAIRSSLDRLSKNPSQSMADFARDIRSGLDDALERQASPQDLASLQTARQQYRAMKQTQQGIVRGTDDVDPSALARAIDTNRNAGQSVYGRGDQRLVQLANAGEMVLGRGSSKLLAAGTVAGAAGLDTLYHYATGKPVSPAEMAGIAGMAGFGPSAARAIVESQAGRAWLQRWAGSQIASKAAAAAGQAGRRIGAGAGGYAAGGSVPQPAADQQPLPPQGS